MRKRRIWKGLKRTGALAAAFCIAAVPFPAFATSPEFAYTEEKWATLRDDKLEYSEIADLIHEYNTTVRQNELDYEDDKGKTSWDYAQDYYDQAAEIAERTEYPDDSSENYASQISSALSNEVSASQMTEKGDDNVDDSTIIKLQYTQTEMGLVKQAQELMINYWKSSGSLETLTDAITQKETAYQQALTKQSAGMALQSAVDTAAEAVTTAKASLQSAQSDLEQTKTQLLILLGWNYGDEVEIGTLPEMDTASIASIDVEADIQTAIANNYSIQITERRVANSRSDTNRVSYESTLANQKETVSTNVKNLYNSLLLALDSYEQAQSSYELEQTELSACELRLSAGTITKKKYEEQESACLSAKVSMESAKYSLMTAKLEYDWAVAGLASAS